MDNVGFIERCFNQWMKEHPDSSYAEFRLLCRFWMHIHDSHYGMYIDTDSVSKDIYGRIFKEEQVDYKKLYEERLKEKPKKQELNSAYGKFMKGGKNDEGTKGDV